MGTDSAVRVAAAMASGGGPDRAPASVASSKRALVTGEQHPPLTVADHSLAPLEVIRAIVDDIDRSRRNRYPKACRAAARPVRQANSEGSMKSYSYQAIPVTIEE